MQFDTITARGALISDLTYDYQTSDGLAVEKPTHPNGSSSVRKFVEVPAARVSSLSITFPLAILSFSNPNKLYISLSDSESFWLTRNKVTAVARIST